MVLKMKIEYVLEGMKWKKRVVATMLILNQRSLRCVEETTYNESERKQKKLDKLEGIIEPMLIKGLEDGEDGQKERDQR